MFVLPSVPTPECYFFKHRRNRASRGSAVPKKDVYSCRYGRECSGCVCVKNEREFVVARSAIVPRFEIFKLPNYLTVACGNYPIRP